MMLFRNLFILLIILASSYGVKGQTTEDHIKLIRAKYKKVEKNLVNCKVIRSVNWYDEEQSKGGIPVIVAYYDTVNHQFIKITEKNEADWHEDVESYYLKDEKLFFLFEKGYSADEMYTAEEMNMTEQELWEHGWEAKTIEAYEQRVYVADGSIIRFLTKHKIFSAEENEFDLSEVKNENGDLTDVSLVEIKSHVQKIVEEFQKRLEE